MSDTTTTETAEAQQTVHGTLRGIHYSTSAAPSGWRITRDGDRPLSWRGWRVGEGEHGIGGTSGYRCDWTRGVKVRVYITTGGRIVTTRHHWSRWQGECGSNAAAAHETAAGALAWLRDEDGTLRDAEAEAWEAACETVEALAGEREDHVE